MDCAEALFHIRNGNFARRVTWPPDRIIAWCEITQGLIAGQMVSFGSAAVEFRRLDIQSGTLGHPVLYSPTFADWTAEDWEFLSTLEEERVEYTNDTE